MYKQFNIKIFFYIKIIQYKNKKDRDILDCLNFWWRLFSTYFTYSLPMQFSKLSKWLQPENTKDSDPIYGAMWQLLQEDPQGLPNKLSVLWPNKDAKLSLGTSLLYLISLLKNKSMKSLAKILWAVSSLTLLILKVSRDL